MSILAAARGLCEVVFLCDRALPYAVSVLDEALGADPFEKVVQLPFRS